MPRIPVSLSNVFPPLLLAIGFIAPTIARADTFTIVDQTSILSILQSGSLSSVSSNSCAGFVEQTLVGCRFLVNRNDGSTVSPTTGDQFTTLAESTGSFVSDQIETHQSLGSISFAEVAVFSTPAGAPLITCLSFGGCTAIEQVGDQVVGTIRWSNGATDSVILRTAADPVTTVPEPAGEGAAVVCLLAMLIYRRQTRSQTMAS